MNPVEIAYFKHFLYDKGIQKKFIFNYREYHIKDSNKEKGNPESIEEFLQEISSKDVIMKAFYFFMHTLNNRKKNLPSYLFWNSINKDWQNYLDMNRNNYNNNKFRRLVGTFSILRQNWDKERYFEDESKEETYKRMSINPENENLTMKSITPAHEENKDPLEENNSDKTKPTEKTEQVNNPVTQGISNFLAGFTMIDTNNYRNGKQLSNLDVSINLNNGTYKMTFSLTQSEIIKNKGFVHVYLLTKDNTGEIALKFTREKNPKNGCRLNLPKEKKDNVCINSIDLTKKIQKFFKTKEPYFTLNIVNTTTVNDEMYYIMRKKEE